MRLVEWLAIRIADLSSLWAAVTADVLEWWRQDELDR